MFKPFKGRTVQQGQPVRVYRNLHTGTFSILDAQTNLVLGHASDVMLCHAHFQVREAGRQRVLREKKKNVHAFAVGIYISGDIAWRHTESWDIATYNPYVAGDFLDASTGRPVTGTYLYVYLSGAIARYKGEKSS